MGEGRELSVSVSLSQPLSSELCISRGSMATLQARNLACSEKEAQPIQRQPSGLRTRPWEECVCGCGVGVEVEGGVEEYKRVESLQKLPFLSCLGAPVPIPV